MRIAIIRLLATGLVATLASLPPGLLCAQDELQRETRAPSDDQAKEVPGPEPIPAFQLDPLKTVPIRRESPGSNWVVADASPLPKDPEGIWVLEFSYNPVRLIEVEIPNKGRRKVHYLYYRVVNRTGQVRRFVPQFTLLSDDGKRHEDVVLPLAARKIQAKEDPTKDLSGAVSVMGELAPSVKAGIDDAFYGVAIWDSVDFKADAFKINVRGLSNAYQLVEPAEGGEPLTRYKALRLDFTRYGDERNPHNKEIRLGEPPYEWTYFP